MSGVVGQRNPKWAKTYRWRDKNKEKCKEIQRRSRAKHREKRKAEIDEWRKAHPENCKQYYLRQTITRMGLSVKEFNARLEKQNGVCAICGKTNPNGRRLFVDHNHQTGQIRGLLCGHCNTGIGNFLESAELLYSAISYLKGWNCGFVNIDTYEGRESRPRILN
jgi:hypothetical protein